MVGFSIEKQRTQRGPKGKNNDGKKHNSKKRKD